MPSLMTEYPDRRVWDLTDFTLDSLNFSFQVILQMAGRGGSMIVIIGMPMTLHTGSGIEFMDPEKSTTAANLLSLLHRNLATLTAFRDGTLVVTFEDGTEIRVTKHEQYESWETHGDGEVADIGMLCSGHDGSPWGA